MMKKYLIIFTIILISALAVFVYYTRDEIAFSKEVSVYKAVPITAPLFVEFKSFKSISEETAILNALEISGIARSFFNFSKKISEIIQNNQNVSGGIRNEPFMVAFSFAGKNELFPLYIKKVTSVSKKQDLEFLVKNLFPESSNVYSSANYNGHNQVVIKNSAGDIVFQYCIVSGLFIASNKTILVEESLRQMANFSITENLYFTKVNKTVTQQSEISVYVNHKQFPGMLAKIVNQKSKKENNEFGKDVQKSIGKAVQDFSDFAAWTELDVNFNKNFVSLHGISAADDSLQHFLSVFDGQSPVRFNADKVLPKNISFYYSIALSDKEMFFENLENHFKHSSNFYTREEQIRKIEKEFGIDFHNAFTELVKDEIVVATSAIPGDPQKKVSYFILHTEGKTSSEKFLEEWIIRYGERNNIDNGSLLSSFSVDNETKFKIYTFPFPSFAGIWLGKPFALTEAAYCTFHENYLVFSNSKNGLEEYLQSMVLESTLSKDINYMRFKGNIENRANISTYVNINRAFSWQKELFNNDVTALITEQEELIRKFGMANWQVVNNKNIYFNSLVIAFDENAREDAQTTWQSNIGRQVAGKPAIVVNHNDKLNNEVILQARDNNVYQVTKDGRVRWNLKIDAPIVSKIFQIDYYRNGKLQYLFNTKNKLYVIDRDGNNVAHFPVAFRSPATNGVNVFDYDNNRKYRYFIACENKKVYAYNTEGDIVTGWKFGETDFQVTTPVQHFRVANKDYIVFKDKSRIYIQNRRGEKRVEVQKQFENSDNPLVLNRNGAAKMVASAKNGKVYYISFNGSVTEKATDNFSENHFFTCDDINGNGMVDFIFVDGKELVVMDENGEKLYTEKFKNEILHPPYIYTFSSKVKKVGVVDSEANKVYLFNPDGNLHDGFPLQGNTAFSIGKISLSQTQLNLLVGSEGGDLYNYTLN